MNPPIALPATGRLSAGSTRLLPLFLCAFSFCSALSTPAAEMKHHEKFTTAPAPTADGYTTTSTSSAHATGESVKTKERKHKRKSQEVQPTGERGKALEQYRNQDEDEGWYEQWSGDYRRWLMKQDLLIRKAAIFLELAFIIAIGVVLGQIIEVAGLSKYLSILALPILWLGRLPREAGAPLIIAFQSGAAANSMLAGSRNLGEFSNRQLYTSVLIVSCLSLFAHLPIYITPIFLAFGTEAAGWFFGVRFGAIAIEILVILLISTLIVRRFTGDNPYAPPPLPTTANTAAENGKSAHKHAEKKKGGFWRQVFSRSRRTLSRVLLFMLPAYLLMVGLEYYNAFKWLEINLPGLFSYSFLPPQAAGVITAQALNLYNGAILAGNYVDEGVITANQAVGILLFGSLLTAPIRTLKHALPTYIAVLGPGTGMLLAISAQILRILFLGAATAAYLIWIV